MVGRFVASRLHVTPSLVGCIGQTWDVGRKFSRECDTVHNHPITALPRQASRLARSAHYSQRATTPAAALVCRRPAGKSLVPT
jgi:hypothetical protein